MNPAQARIIYLFHSGYAVETRNHFLIFDYYQPQTPKPADITSGIISGAYLKDKRSVLVFSSHRHGDHFDSKILEWSKANPEITYILSNDIRTAFKGPHLKLLGPYQETTIGDTVIKTFGSTDEGISFWVRVDGLAIFHAGDLNWWQWKEDTPEDQAKAVQWFRAEVDRIAGSPVDIAFFPVDRRLEEYYASGAEYFAVQIQPKLLLPMHFGEDYGATEAFAEKAREKGIKTVAITRRGQEIPF